MSITSVKSTPVLNIRIQTKSSIHKYCESSQVQPVSLQSDQVFAVRSGYRKI